MKLSLLQENFNTALASVSRFISAKSQLPILSNILLSTDSGRLKLSATNLELGINYWIGSKITTEGGLTVPAKEITEFVSYLPPGRIDLELDSQNLLHLATSKAQSTFTTIPPSDYPSLPGINPDTAFDLDLSILNQAVAQVTAAAAADDTRPVLTAVLFQLTPNALSLVATDGFRLSQKLIRLVNPVDLHQEQPLVFLIPSRSLVEVTKLARSSKTVKMGLTPDGHQLVFVLDDLELVSRLIEGDYPNYQRIIPESFATKIFVNKSEFSQSIKIASVFAKESANVVKFNVKPSSVELTANAPQLGQNQASFEARVEGEPLQIAFNYKFVSEFLSVCKGDEIVIELNESLTPGFFHDQSDPEFVHIIMPVRLQD
ncbi:MAG: DNA polymerase III subunit beta [Candidatus Shapirobacteria bacterium]|jgi:DNA polymerase-3 subunit beta